MNRKQKQQYRRAVTTKKETRAEHAAANGRLTTACGIKMSSPNSKANEAFSSNRPDPKCLDCRGVLAGAKEGNIFCLVACSEDGSATALKEARKAYETAAALCRKLDLGWHPHVWENLGWHWRVTREGWSISRTADGFFLRNYKGRITFYGSRRTLRATIRAAQKHIDDVVAAYTRARILLPNL